MKGKAAGNSGNFPADKEKNDAILFTTQLSGSKYDLSIAHLFYYAACGLGNHLKANTISHFLFTHR